MTKEGLAKQYERVLVLFCKKKILKAAALSCMCCLPNQQEDYMYLFRAFIAGLVIPSIILPIALCVAYSYGNTQLLEVPIVHWIPVIWGVWNALYFAICKDFLPGGLTIRHFLAGGSLGLLLAFYAVFWLHLPSLIGLPEAYTYWPLLIAPIVYALVWAYLVHPLNKLLGLREE